MGRTSLQDVRSLPDALQQWNWDLIIPAMPGTANSRAFTIKAMTTSIPGAQLEPTTIDLHGVTIKQAGRVKYTNTLPVTLLETRDMSTRLMIRNWQKMARDLATNSGSYKSVYATTIEMVLYDDVPQVVQRLRLVGAWPESLDDTSVDSGQAGAVQFNVTFSYDYVDE
jgi:hypothetical protein